jgi:hypothetical protein
VDLEDLRLAVYVTFARHGHAPTTTQLADQIAAPVDDVRTGLQQLAAARHIVLSDAGDIVMAHPFSAIPLGFSVMGTDTLWWGGCAWDSFAMPHLLTTEPALLVATTCPGCSTPHAWNLIRAAPPSGRQIAHFLTPTAHMWDEVVHTCGHQRIFCNETCLAAWLQQTGNTRGYAMDLPTLWNFASDWYTGRLDRGYTRRDPARAADYLRSVGLSGPFWGL